QWSLQVKSVLGLHPALRQCIGSLTIVYSRVFESPADVSREGDRLSILQIAFHGAITKAERECRVGRLGKATLGESRFGNRRAVTAYHGIDCVLKVLTNCSSRGIGRAHYCN